MSFYIRREVVRSDRGSAYGTGSTRPLRGIATTSISGRSAVAAPRQLPNRSNNNGAMAQHQETPTTPVASSTGETLWTSGVAGVVACIWYALPDYVLSKRRRALVKTVLLASAGLYGAWMGRKMPIEDSGDAGGSQVAPGLPGESLRGYAAPAQGQAAPDRTRQPDARTDAWWLRLRPGTQLVVVAGAITVLTAGSIAAERTIYGVGERLARRGVSRPHTRVGLVLGALAPLAAVARTGCTAQPRT